MFKTPTTLWYSIRKLTFLIMVGIVPLLVTSCSEDQLKELTDFLRNQDKNNPIPDRIDFTRAGLYPEGVSHDAKGKRFLVSSVGSGTIGAVKYDGTYIPFIEDNELISTIGLKIDQARKRVLVAIADPGASEKSSPETIGQLAALGIYDLATGNSIKFVNLGALRPGKGHFANDIAIDPQGNAYISDSFSPIIYKVDVNGNASVFFENEAFATSPGQFGFNGIAHHPSGYLIVAFSRDNKLIKIPTDNPSTFSEVMIDATLMNPDGLLLSNNGKQLIVVNNAGGRAGKIMSFESDNKWETGMLINTFETGEVFPTTATAYKKEVFVLYAYLNKLSSQPPVSQFTIKQVPFSSNQNF